MGRVAAGIAEHDDPVIAVDRCAEDTLRRIGHRLYRRALTEDEVRQYISEQIEKAKGGESDLSDECIHSNPRKKNRFLGSSRT